MSWRHCESDFNSFNNLVVHFLFVVERRGEESVKLTIFYFSSSKIENIHRGAERGKWNPEQKVLIFLFLSIFHIQTGKWEFCQNRILSLKAWKVHLHFWFKKRKRFWIENFSKYDFLVGGNSFHQKSDSYLDLEVEDKSE